jgi:hypothetical protein
MQGLSSVSCTHALDLDPPTLKFHWLQEPKGRSPDKGIVLPTSKDGSLTWNPPPLLEVPKVPIVPMVFLPKSNTCAVTVYHV